MRIDQAKALHLRDVLSAMGHEPVKEAKGEYWYASPLRQETEASFSITADGYAWHDFGSGKGGNVLDLIMQHQRTDVRGALQFLDSLNLRHATTALQTSAIGRQKELWDASEKPSEARTRASGDWDGVDSPQEQEDVFTVTSVKPLHNRALIQYLQRRGIDSEVARDWVQEIYYRRSDKPYFALAFANDSGAYEARNPYFKGIIGGSKDITTIAVGEGDLTDVAVFEGFMDFLSAIMLSGHPPTMPVLVLNSTAMQGRAIEAIQQMGVATVHLYLDRDVAGQELTDYFTKHLAGITVMDKSPLYDGYKDLNDYLVSRGQATSRAA